MIYQEVGEVEFVRAFEAYGRNDQFSREGLRALFDHIYTLSEETGEDWQLDVIAVCCDFTEYETLQDAAEAYGMTEDELQDSTLILFVGPDETGPVIIEDF